MIKTALGWILGERAWLVLLAVGAVGAWLYADLRAARAERDAVIHWAELACATGGASYATAAKAKPGAACRLRIAELATFKATTDQRSAALLAEAMAEHDARTAQDTLSAKSAAQAARDAAATMEAANAEAERRNLVDRTWFAAVNGVAGLRAAPAGH